MGLMGIVDQTLSPGQPVTSSLARARGLPAGRMAPGLNGSVIGGHTNRWPIRGLGVDQVGARGSNFPSGLVMGLALGAAVGGLLLSMAVVAVLCRKWYGTRRKSSYDFDLDDRLTITSSRSAPPTRSNSMDHGRRGKTQMVRSVTMDMISIDTEMTTAEAVQPDSPEGTIPYTGKGPGIIHQAHSDISSSAYESDESYEEKLPVHTEGRLCYSLDYNPTDCHLTVDLFKAKYLKGREQRTLRDPYVVLCLLPDEKNKVQSRTHRKTLHPTFNETFTFHVAPSDLSKRVLRMSVYDVDRRRVRHTLGHVFAHLSDIDAIRGDVHWSDLEPNAQYKGLADTAEIQLTLTFMPAAEELKVSVDAIRAVPAFRTLDTEGIYVKMSLQQSGRRVSSQKTAVVYDVTAERFWHFSEPFIFRIPTKTLESCSVRAVVYLKSSSEGRSVPVREYGRVTLGSHMYAQHNQLAHWKNMLAHMRHPVTAWHTIAPPPPIQPTSLAEE